MELSQAQQPQQSRNNRATDCCKGGSATLPQQCLFGMVSTARNTDATARNSAQQSPTLTCATAQHAPKGWQKCCAPSRAQQHAPPVPLAPLRYAHRPGRLASVRTGRGRIELIGLRHALTLKIPGTGPSEPGHRQLHPSLTADRARPAMRASTRRSCALRQASSAPLGSKLGSIGADRARDHAKTPANRRIRRALAPVCIFAASPPTTLVRARYSHLSKYSERPARCGACARAFCGVMRGRNLPPRAISQPKGGRVGGWREFQPLAGYRATSPISRRLFPNLRGFYSQNPGGWRP
jgi:hypothetical protein